MEIYVLKDGTRRGPFLPFKLREMLEEGEIHPTDQGWVEGMEGWAPLASMEAVSAWMPRDPALPPPLPSPLEPTAARSGTGRSGGPASISPGEENRAEPQWQMSQAWTRWVARLVDEVLWFTLIWAIGVGSGWLGLWNFTIRSHPALLLGPPLLWIFVEALLLSRWGTTPGKWVMGLRVNASGGGNLTYGRAMKRSALVLFLGHGLGLPYQTLLPVLQAGMAWMIFKRTGSTLWDRAAGSEVDYKTPGPMGYALTAAVVALWLALNTWIFFQAPLPADLPQDLRQRVLEMRQQLDERMQNLQPPSGPGTPAA